jgi:hypothetical protein
VLSEGTTEEIKDSILAAKMWTNFTLRQALIAEFEKHGFTAKVSQCAYTRGTGMYKLQVEVFWKHKEHCAAEREIKKVASSFMFSTIGWSTPFKVISLSKLEFYAECGVFRD